jgi:hypothetical protein
MSAFRFIARALQLFLAEDAGPVLPRWSVAAAAAATVAPTDHVGCSGSAAAAAVPECPFVRMAEAGAAPSSVWIAVRR